MNAYIKYLVCIAVFYLSHTPELLAQSAQDDIKGNKYAASFNSMDKDHSGAVTYEEYLGWHEDLIRKHFAQQDKDGDGLVTRSEFTAERDNVRSRMGGSSQQVEPLQ